MNWKKALLITANVLIAAYLLLAVTAFNKPDEKATVCSEVKINITDNIMDGFLNANEIKKILENEKVYPLERAMKAINTREIEEILKRSPFVDHAQCYKTQSGHVCISLTQRMPIVRVKSNDGDDYYIDNRGGIMPNTKYVSDIIIATGNISRNYAKSTLMRVSNYIVYNKFWQNQIVQINVLSDGSLEIVPRVGEHIVYLGRATNVQKKLNRLEKFYKYGLSQAGWNKYAYINLEFDNQIICKKKEAEEQLPESKKPASGEPASNNEESRTLN
jgi:cell division protein FtsQ